MKVEIQDPKALEQIPSSSVLAYLRSSEWLKEGTWGVRGTLYTKQARGRSWDILIPSKDTVPGYARNMFETISVLSEVEERPQLDVVRELLSAGSDVVRLADLSGGRDRSFTLQDSASLTSSVHGMFQAAARAAEHPAAAYSGRLTGQVTEYMDSVEVYYGDLSYFDLAVHSPVPLEVQGSLFPTDPFSRLVTATLSRALAATEIAVGRAVTNGGLSAFERAIEDGVSANLCDSVSQLAKRGNGIDISMKWAPIRRAPGKLESQFRFRRDAGDVLSDAWSYLRQREPYHDEEIVGVVVLLARDVSDRDGLAHIIPDRRDLPVPLRASFASPEYDRLIEAFKKQSKIRLRADIVPKGRIYDLENPAHLQILEVDE